MPEQRDNPVFLLGSGRCGSSLLQELLSRHRGVGFLSNFDDRGAPARLGAVNGAVYRRVSQERTRKGRIRFAPSEGYEALSREVSPLVSRPGRPLDRQDATPWLATRLERFFLDRWARQGTAVFLHKFTGWPRAGLIDAVFPRSRFINVVRDGRAVASSLVQMPWWRDAQDLGTLTCLGEDRALWEAEGSRYPLLAGLVWKHVVQAHERARDQVPSERWLDVRYEDVLRDPRHELGRMLDHMGLEWDSSFEAQFSAQQLWTGRADAFRGDLGPSDLDALERHLAPALHRQGYQTGAARDDA